MPPRLFKRLFPVSVFTILAPLTALAGNGPVPRIEATPPVQTAEGKPAPHAGGVAPTVPVQAPASVPPASPPPASLVPGQSIPLTLLKDIRHTMDRAQAFLIAQQGANGAWKHDPAVTGLVLHALLLDPLYNPSLASEQALGRGFAFLEGFVKPDGGIYRKEYAHYTTAVCLMAFAETRQERYADIIRQARAYLLEQQIDAGEGYEESHPYYGGIGYGGDDRPDLSNTHLCLEAIRAADQYQARYANVLPASSSEIQVMEKDQGVHWQKALTFLARCQNLQAVNRMPYATDDGGFIYETGTYKAERSHSYGSMTYAGVKSLLFAQVKRDDPRVQRAVDWIRGHYTWTENPGFNTTSLYYYYMTAAKCLRALESPTLTASDGTVHDWRADLGRQIVSMQREDGSWANTNGQYWENIPDLCTAYALTALKHCLASLNGQ